MGRDRGKRRRLRYSGGCRLLCPSQLYSTSVALRRGLAANFLAERVELPAQAFAAKAQAVRVGQDLRQRPLASVRLAAGGGVGIGAHVGSLRGCSCLARGVAHATRPTALSRVRGLPTRPPCLDAPSGDPPRNPSAAPVPSLVGTEARSR